MDKATLRPWKMSDRYGIEGANGERVSLSRFTLSGGEKCDANDSLVLEAVNAYDKLRRDNEALLGVLKDCMYEIRDRSDIKKKALEVIKQVEADHA